MTILSFADTRFPIERANGLQTMATCHALAERGHDVRLVVRPDSERPPRDPFTFYGLPPLARLRIETVAGIGGPRARRARFVAAAAGLAATAGADVIFTRDLGLSAVLLQLSVWRRPPLVYESHGVASLVSGEMPALLGKPELAPAPEKIARLDRRDRRVWRQAPAYVTITRALADDLTARFGARDRVFVVPDGAALDTSAIGRRMNGPPIAGYGGHLYPWKGVDVFVQALALAPDVHGLIVGGHPREADLARVRALVERLGLSTRVTITGLVPPAEVRHRLASATMLVLPNTPSAISERFTSPLKLFEYLNAGRPIIASDVPSIREVLTDGETGLLVPPGDAGALAAAMERVTRDTALSLRLAGAALALAPSFTWQRRAERLEAAFAAARQA